MCTDLKFFFLQCDMTPTIVDIHETLDTNNKAQCATYKEHIRLRNKAWYDTRKDDDAFKRKRCEQSTAWYYTQKNNEAFKKRKSDYDKARHASHKHDIEYKIKEIKIGARKRGIEWHDDMTDEVCRDKLTGPCFFCGVHIRDEIIGIDRMDSSKGYSVDNCSGCCEKCNRMKMALDVQTFLEQCIQRASNGTVQTTRWRPTTSSSFAQCKKRAHAANLDFNLSESYFNKCRNMPCHYCHRDRTKNNLASGLDRIDNGKGYIIGNVVPCCTDCNYARRTLTITDFQRLNTRISERAPFITYPKMNICLNPMTAHRKQCKS